MAIACERDSGQIGRGSATVPMSLNSGKEIQQISVFFSGTSKDVRDSYLKLSYADGTRCEFPTPRQVRRIHGGTTESSEVNLTKYSVTSNAFGYYVKIGFELEGDVDIVLENGDSHSPTSYECVALYYS